MKSIAENTGAGMVCCLNPESFEMISISSEPNIEGFWRSEEEGKDFAGEYDFWSEEFVDQLHESHLKNNHSKALNLSHPFRNFTKIVHECQDREDWFVFNQKELEKRVYRQLFDEGII